jgi:pyruvate ferredoxin oxidoreductase delta subunit
MGCDSSNTISISGLSKIKGWREIPSGGVITDAGNSQEYETGGWRSFRPIWDDSKCNNCKVCWVYCPDGSILVRDGVVSGIDLAHCKGCGICSKECPQGAIEMVEESRAEEKVGQ